MRILLVEDDTLLGDGLATGLRQAGYTVDWLMDGQTAAYALQSETFDAVVLDLGIPRLSGMELLKHLRANAIATPVLILTARDALGDKVSGLDAGADDYLVKPVDLDELAARLRALLRRTNRKTTPLLNHGDLTLDVASHRVTLAEQAVELSTREFAILQTLLENKGHVMTRRQIEDRIYGWRDEPESNTVEVHIHHLRRKLGNDIIRTLRGVGYIIERLP